jgi:hypothetical protein
MFIELTCKFPHNPIKKKVRINVDKILYFLPNSVDGSNTMLNCGDGNILVADESYEAVCKMIETEEVKCFSNSTTQTDH